MKPQQLGVPDVEPHVRWGGRREVNPPADPITQHHFDASRVLIPIVTFVAETLVPLMVVAPKNHVLLPPETATGLLPGGSVVELHDGSWLQPTNIMVTDKTPMMIAFFIKRNLGIKSKIFGRIGIRLSYPSPT